MSSDVIRTALVVALRVSGLALLAIGISKVVVPDPTSWVSMEVARSYGAAEAAAGVSLAVVPTADWARAIAVALVAAASAVLLVSLAAGLPAAGCGCFGTAFRVQSPWVHMLVSGAVLMPIGLSFYAPTAGESHER